MQTEDPPVHFRHSYTKARRKLLNRLSRIEGQVRGIRRLVDGEAYCLDVLQQVEAMTAAADQVALLVLEDHIDGCLTHAIATGEGEPYVAEVMEVVRRAIGRRGARRAAVGPARPSGSGSPGPETSGWGREGGVPQGGTTTLPR